MFFIERSGLIRTVHLLGTVTASLYSLYMAVAYFLFIYDTHRFDFQASFDDYKISSEHNDVF